MNTPAHHLEPDDCPHENTWFDRVLCGVCDSMHTYCYDCGMQLDSCRGNL